ncbi:MAG: DUF1150 family protein [Rhodospirillaceae bacterium]
MQQTELNASRMSVQDFTLLGIHEFAYVKPVTADGNPAFAIFAADGTQIANIQTNREVAFAAVRQHELEPVSVH